MVSKSSENNSTIVNKVLTKLRKEILSGKLKEGERLIQDEWAKKLNVSRMPICEALTHLEIEGLVEIIPHQRSDSCDFITPEDIEEIYYLRYLLEGIVVEKSLPHLTDEDIEQLGDILHEMETLQLTDDTYDRYAALTYNSMKFCEKEARGQRVNKIVDNLGISPIAPKLLAKYYKKHSKNIDGFMKRFYAAIRKK